MTGANARAGARGESRWTRALAAFAATALVAAGLTAQEPCPCPPPEPPPPPLWTGSVGLSFLSTSGNTDTQSLGLSATFARQPTPWGLEVTALANQAETDGVTTAENELGAIRGKRALGDRFELFAGGSYESNEFAGFDSRVIIEAGGLWKALTGAKHELAFDAGLTWTDEDPVFGDGDESTGALLGMAYVWKITEHAAFRQRLIYYPNFDTSDDWRLRSESTLEAALASSWALRVGYLYTNDNLPAPGFGETDTTTSVSLVWKR